MVLQGMKDTDAQLKLACLEIHLGGAEFSEIQKSANSENPPKPFEHRPHSAIQNPIFLAPENIKAFIQATMLEI
uniref:Uncharacterized protein n=1 Tax=Romanomermis culicivorax TaxID=13658 RepID=A0A915HSL8_ROMCU